MHHSIHLVHDDARRIVVSRGLDPKHLATPLGATTSTPFAGVDLTRREAARGIVQNGSSVLLMYTERYDDFSLPGGGVDPDETPEAAVKRELMEEAGAHSIRLVGKFAEVTEYLPAWKQNGAILFQTSHCYQCELQGNLAANRLEHYERANGMSAQWVTLDDALRHNRKVIAAQPASMGISIQRETCLLELVYASNQHLTGNSG